MGTAWYRRDGEDLVLSLHIQPNASRDGIDGLHGDRLKLRLAAPPVDGKANAQLKKFPAAGFDVPRRQILIEAGEQGRRKRVRIRRPARVPPELADLIG